MHGSDGTDHHIDFSPYHKPTAPELEAVREIVRITGVIPTRAWNLNNNFHGPDILSILNEVEKDHGA